VSAKIGREEQRMDDRGTTANVPGVTFKRVLGAPIERVWAHLTQPHLLPGWYGQDARIEPREGGTIWLMGGHVRGVVTVWQPPHRLAYSWNVFDPGDPPDAVSPYPPSYPGFRLEPQGEDVLLTFRHFPVLERFAPQNAMGWHSMLDMLAAAVRGDEVEDRSTYMRRNAPLYGVDLDNLTQ
jgi:uncharacterized protein YndB with AHSA1/START domain